MNRLVRIVVWIAITLSVLLCLASCKDSSDGKTTPIFLNYSAERVDLDLNPQQYIMDADKESEEYKVLIGTPEIIDNTEVMLEDNTPAIVRDHASYKEPYTSLIHSTVRFYDKNFSFLKESETEVEFARLFDKFNGVNYIYRGHVVSYAYPQYAKYHGNNILQYLGNYYQMCKGKSVLFRFFSHEASENYVILDDEGNILESDSVPYIVGDVSIGPGTPNPVGLRDCQYWVKDSVVYSVTMVTGYEGNFLFVNDRKIGPPTPNKNIPVSEIHGVAEIDEQMYVIMHYNKKGNAIGERPTPMGILVPIDEKTTEINLDKAIELEVAPTGMCATDGRVAFFMAGTELYRTDGKSCDLLTNIEMCGYNETSTVRRIRPLSDGSFLMVVDYRLVVLTPSEEEFVSNIQKLTLGYVGQWVDPDLQKRVDLFNRAGKNTVVELKSYSNISDLNLALLSGEVDLVVSDDKMVMRNYMRQGYLAALDEICPALFEGDKLIASIVEASRIEGHIYELPRKFSLFGWTVPVDAEIPEDSIEAFVRVLMENPEVDMTYTTQGFLLELLGSRNMDEWVDWENQSCHFDDGSFAAVLEFCSLGAKSNEEIIWNEDIPDWDFPYLMQSMIMPDSSLQDMVNPPIKVKYIPTPSAVNTGSSISGNYYLGAVDKENKSEFQKDFLDFFFLSGKIREDEGSGSGFSVNKAEMEEQTKRPEKDYEYGEAEKDLVWEIVNGATHFQYVKNDVTEVIMEEAGRYFAGDITAEKAAEYIQNRISIYLAEQS